MSKTKTKVTGALWTSPSVLTDALKAVKPAVASRMAIEALSGVRIAADGRGAFLYATNLETGVRRTLPCTAVEPIDVVVNHADVEKAAKALAKAPEIRLEHVDDELVCKGGTRVVRLKTLKRQDFPDLPGDLGSRDGDGAVVLTADAPTLAKVIARAHPFASTDETRPILTGIHIDTHDCTMCVTDSYRLAVLKLDAIPVAKHTLNIPARGLKLAAKAMKAGVVTVSKFAQWAVIDNRAAGERWTIRLIDGQYPNWRQLIPDDFSYELTVVIPVDELRSASELAVQFSRRNAPMRVNVNGEVTVAGHSPDVCSFEEKLPGASITKTANGSWTDGMEIGFNPEFMRDVAKTVESKYPMLKLISPLRPGLIVDGEDRFLLMPIRL